MADEMAMEIATLIARKAVEALADPTKEAVGKLVTKIRNRFRGDKPAEVALAVAEADPAVPANITALAEALERLAAADPEFATDMRSLHSLTQNALIARDEGVVNHFQGTAEKVVQLRDVHGDLHL